jgi:hypothetical protein
MKQKKTNKKNKRSWGMIQITAQPRNNAPTEHIIIIYTQIVALGSWLGQIKQN